MIVEDNRFIRTGWEAVIQANKRFNLIGSFPDCEAAFKSEAPLKADLVLMDIQMPVMNGLEATKAIRSPDSTVLWPDIPIIALTANVMKGDRENCIANGMDDFISKPIHPEELYTKIKKIFDLIS